MSPQKLIWEAQSNDIWKLAASELQKKSSEIDLYLQASKSSERILNFLDNEVLLTEPAEVNYLSKNTNEVTCFAAHRLMLSAASPFFKKLLHDHYNDYKDTCVTISLPNIPAYCIRYILDFIYCGSININPNVFENVLEIAKILEVSCLVHYFNPSLCLEQICIPIQKEKKKKVKKNKVLQNVKKCITDSKLTNLYKEDKSGIQLKRSSRIVKCRYNSDIYEVNLPKLRKTKVKKTDESESILIKQFNAKQGENMKTNIKEKVHINENQVLGKDEDHHTYALNPVTEKDYNFTANTFISRVKNTDIIEGNNPNKVITSSSYALNQSTLKVPEIMKKVKTKNDISLCIENKKDSYDSVDVINALDKAIHISSIQKDSNLKDNKYEDSNIGKGDVLQNMITVKIGNKEFGETSDSIDEMKSFETQAYDGIHPNSVNVLKNGQSDLSKQDRSTVDVNDCFSLEQLNISLKPSEVSPKPARVEVSFNGIDNIKQGDGYEIEDEEDGLFKLQVLLKECEDFTDSQGVPTSANDDISGKSDVSQPVKFTGVESGIDFNQWISEEIHSYMIPKIDQNESQLSSLDQNKLKSDSLVSDSFTSSEQKKEDKLIQKIDKVDVDLPDTEDDEEMEEKTEYQCEECNKIFDNLQSIKSHIRGVHEGATQMCKFCGKLFKRRCDLHYHEKRHKNATLPCNMCDKSFKLKKDLNAHMTTHMGGKKFTCVHCNKELTSQRNLKNHISSVHFKQRGFTCNICNKSYTKAATLQVHIRSVHTGERPYVCEICNKNFADSSLLKIHQYTHTGERKYACKICKSRFNQYRNLMNHLRVHSNDRPFVCLICKDKFKSRESLLKHKWMHTGLKPLKCQHCSKEFRIKESFERHMRKFHGENLQLPEIYFEISETPERDISSEGKVISSIKDSVVAEETDSYLFESRFMQESQEQVSQNFNSNSVIEIVNGIAKDSVTELQYLSNSGSEIQLSYPVLASHLTNENSSAMNILSNSISENIDSESIDMESLINSNENSDIERHNPSNSSVLIEKYIDTDMTIKNQFLIDNVIKSQLENTVTQISEKLVVLEDPSSMPETEISGHEVSNLASVGELTGLDDSDSPSFKIWLSQSDGSLSNVVVDVPEERNHNILIVSDPQDFSNDRESLSLLNSQAIEQELMDTMDMGHV